MGSNQKFMRGSQPRRLNRKRRLRRQTTAGFLIVALTVSAAVCGWLAGTQLLQLARTAPAFAVTELDIDRCPRVDTGDLHELNLIKARRANIFSIHLGRLAREVERHPWVESCSIKRILPGTLRVRLVEKTPAALARHGERLLLVDRTGAVIEEPADPAEWAGGLALFTGFDGDLPWPAHRQRLRSRLPLAERLKEMERSATLPPLVEIDMTDDENIRIHFAHRGYPVLMGRDGYGDKLNRYRLLQETLEERHGGNLQYVDLRFRDRVIVKPIEGMGEEEGRS
jgi:cell division protein FtsQ